MPAPWSALRDWMSLSRTSCNNNMHYYPLSLLPSPSRAFFCLFFSIFPIPPRFCPVDILTHHYAVACVFPFFLLSLFFAADVVTLSLSPTSLAAHTHFWGEILRFFNGIIWSIILSLLRRVELFFSNTSQLVSRPWVRWSTTGHSLLSTKVILAFERVPSLLRSTPKQLRFLSS